MKGSHFFHKEGEKKENVISEKKGKEIYKAHLSLRYASKRGGTLYIFT